MRASSAETEASSTAQYGAVGGAPEPLEAGAWAARGVGAVDLAEGAGPWWQPKVTAANPKSATARALVIPARWTKPMGSGIMPSYRSPRLSPSADSNDTRFIGRIPAIRSAHLPFVNTAILIQN